jgi:hypothetical protein
LLKLSFKRKAEKERGREIVKGSRHHEVYINVPAAPNMTVFGLQRTKRRKKNAFVGNVGSLRAESNM